MSNERINCSRCSRNLIAERPLRLPDNRVYCAACCESMAADDFEMETGESFTRWIEKHPQLIMQYQPLELNVRRFFFFFPLLMTVIGACIFAFGVNACIKTGTNLLYPLAGLIFGALIVIAELLDTAKLLMRIAGVGSLIIYGAVGMLALGRPFAFSFVGIAIMVAFVLLTIRGLQGYLRAMNFRLTLKEGTFHLQHGARRDTFSADDVTQACVVRPGTVGATEGALRLQDGRMLTLDTCLSDLHALGVVMDLRFRSDFPPSADDLAKVRRDKLRKIRGLS